MLRIFLKTAWRSIIRNRMFSFLNIVGLAIGMGVALLIGLWVNYQQSYDKFLPDYEEAYQVKINYGKKGDIFTQNEVPIPLAAAIKGSIAGIENAALTFESATYGPLSQVLAVGEKKLGPTGLAAGADFLKIFKYTLLKGSADQVLQDPEAIVLSESTAKALFGNEDPVGKTVTYNNWAVLKVTGVLQDLPANSSFHFDFLTQLGGAASYDWIKHATTDWNQEGFKLYVSLKPNTTQSQVAAQISQVVKQYKPAVYNTFHKEPVLHPLKDWHLYSEFSNGLAVGGLVEYVRIFFIIGILVLVIACINFMNLATARSEKRAVEVGIKKVVGAGRRTLIIQFLLESVMLSFASLLLALVIVQSALPPFNAMAGTDIHIPFANPMFWCLMLGYIVVTGCLAGSRPAFYLSSFQPVKVLKGRWKMGRSGALPRKVLIVLQFSSSIAFIIGTIVIYQQINYAKQRPRGYNANRLLVTEGGSGNQYAAIKREALESGMVTDMTTSFTPPTEINLYANIERWTGGTPADVPLKVSLNAIGDADYFKTIGMKFSAGRNFDGVAGKDDSTNVIVNEAAIKRMNIQQPLNQTISWSYSTLPKRLRIIGVVNDALTNAPFAPVEPTVYVYQGWIFTVSYRLSPTVDTHVALDKLGKIFNKYRPDIPFQYHFIDESYAAKFEMETLVGKLAGIFATLAIFISCLGLFGLAAYVAEQRTREIGIRKVLGASVRELFFLVIKDFVVLVMISCLIAIPIALYFLSNWLQGYYYHIAISPLVFLVSAVGAIVIAIITTSIQAVKAALMNPVKSLRAE
jgi:putative ABC transport system permease protein